MRIWLAILMLTATLQAGLVNAVAITVGDKPITLYDIDKTRQTRDMSSNEAAQHLIRQKLREMEIERLGIEVSEYELTSELEQMAQSNDLTLTQLEQMIQNSGRDFQAYKEEFKNKLQERKLTDKLASSNITPPSQDELKIHYENNIDQFSTFEKAQVTQYVSSSKKALQEQVQNPFALNENVQRGAQTIRADEVSGQLEYMINNTPKGEFTPVVNLSDRYAAFYVKSKEGVSKKNFEDVKQQVQQSWRQKQQEEIVKLHFQKLRAKTQIEIIR